MATVVVGEEERYVVKSFDSCLLEIPANNFLLMVRALGG
jgi:hypothetical protein